MEAVSVGEEQEAARTESYVVFELGGESYALEVAHVREVLDAAALTRVPGSNKALRGLFNVRGHVVPVWDLRVPFELVAAPNTAPTPCVLMVEHGSGPTIRVCGLLVDRVSDVLESLPEDLQPPPALGLGGGSSLIRGLLRHQERFLLVLDLERVLSTLTVGTTPEVP